MRSFFSLFILVFFSIHLFVSCHDDIDYYPEFVLPQSVLLDINVKNEKETPIIIKIRHKYSWIHGDTKITEYSDWSEEYHFNSGEYKTIGVEQARRWNEDTTWYDNGFILHNDEDILNKYSIMEYFSSFEIEINTGVSTFFVYGYTQTNSHPDEISLCLLRISWNRACFFLIKEQGKPLNSDYGYFIHKNEKPSENLTGFIQPVILSITQDDSYTIVFGDIIES